MGTGLCGSTGVQRWVSGEGRHLAALEHENRLEQGRRLSPVAKVYCRCLEKILLDGLCRRRLGLWRV